MTTTLTARGPEDLLAAVPVVLGFHPQQSLVMLTFGAAHTFHARLDLPPPDDASALVETVEALVGPCRTHQVAQVALVAYTGDPAAAARMAAALVPALVAEGLGIVDVLRAHDGLWCRVPLRAGVEETLPVPYWDTAHPFAAHAVFEGRVTHASREELRATLMRDADLEERFGVLLARLPEPGPAEAARVGALVGGWVRSGEDPDDEGAVRVLRAVTCSDVRDGALYAVTRESARDHLRVWAALLRGAPDAQVPDTAALTAFCAWQAGEGALAWCALDRCLGLDPRHVLGLGLAECLARAVAPVAWEDLTGDPGRSVSA
jgi:ADP-ribose pyrophosphatase YjhB (NUDIX family)